MENELIRWLRRRLPGDKRLKVGPGDDAAVLDLADSPDCVLTVDLLSDGVDFVLSEAGPRRVGRKALAVNLSDLAAMAARPLAAVVALLLPRHGGGQIAKEMYEGMLPLAEKYGVAMAGGDTNSWNGPLAVSITVLGAAGARGPLRRSGAAAGDLLAVTGPLGGSILGRHLDFEPRVFEALWLHDHIELHAGIDISDGLALDLSRLCEESRCGAELWADRIPIHDDARRLAAAQGGRSTADPLDHALSDGEDFELLLALPAKAMEQLTELGHGNMLHVIGRCTSEPGLRLIRPDGRSEPLEPRGWQHQLDG